MTDQDAVIEFLSRPATYGPGVKKVDRIDTHASIVFLVGERAYKLKRAVRYPYLDFSTVALRRAACEAELTVNRRTAPELYLEVASITRHRAGFLAFNGGGDAVDWVVVMRRFNQATLFDRLASRGELSDDLVTSLAEEIARFHGSAEIRRDHGGAAAMAAIVAGNSTAFAASGAFSQSAIDRLEHMSRRVLGRVGFLLDERREAGMVRRCHGDLHLRNICLTGNRPTLFDAIEFCEDFACIDVLYDLAFLLMDLDASGLRSQANRLFNRYIDLTGDRGGIGALPLFMACRAAIRAHTGALAAATQSDSMQSIVRMAETRVYMALALAYLEPLPPRLVAVGGLSGSGKSRAGRLLAPEIGAAPGALVVRSDILRKRLKGVAFTHRLGEEAYSEPMTRIVYDQMYSECARALAAGHSVVADAVFARPDQRAAIQAVAAAANVPFDALWLEAPPEVMIERVETRKGNASDADAAVVRQQLEYDLGPLNWTRINSAGPREATLAACRAAIGL